MEGHPAGASRHIVINSSSPEARSPRHPKLGAVLRGVHGSDGQRVPGAYPQALGVPNPHGAGGEGVWGPRMVDL